MTRQLLLLVVAIVCFSIAALSGFSVLTAPTLAWVAAGLVAYAAKDVP